MEHEVLMRSTLIYNATYILENCALEAKFHHKNHNDIMRSTLIYNATYILENCALEAKFHHKNHNDRHRELSLVIKMYYFNIRHTMIVTIFY